MKTKLYIISLSLLSMFLATVGCKVHRVASVGYEPYIAVTPKVLPSKLVIEFNPMFGDHQFYNVMIDTVQGTFIDFEKTFSITQYFPAVVEVGGAEKISNRITVPMGRLIAYKMNTAVGQYSNGAIVCYDSFARKVLVTESLIRVDVIALDIVLDSDDKLNFTTSFSCTTYNKGREIQSQKFTISSKPKQLSLKQGSSSMLLANINAVANNFSDMVVYQILNVFDGSENL